MSLWSITRLVWGIATLYVFVYNIELLQDSNTPFWSFVVLMLLFLACEIIPIVALLDYSYLNMFGFEQVEIVRRSSLSGGVGGDNETITSQISSSIVGAPAASNTNNMIDPFFVPTITPNARTAITAASPNRSIRFEDEYDVTDPLLPQQK